MKFHSKKGVVMVSFLINKDIVRNDKSLSEAYLQEVGFNNTKQEFRGLLLIKELENLLQNMDDAFFSELQKKLYITKLMGGLFKAYIVASEIYKSKDFDLVLDQTLASREELKQKLKELAESDFKDYELFYNLRYRLKGMIKDAIKTISFLEAEEVRAIFGSLLMINILMFENVGVKGEELELVATKVIKMVVDEFLEK